jgi:hypothetical protein
MGFGWNEKYGQGKIATQFYPYLLFFTLEGRWGAA